MQKRHKIQKLSHPKLLWIIALNNRTTFAKIGNSQVKLSKLNDRQIETACDTHRNTCYQIISQNRFRDNEFRSCKTAFSLIYCHVGGRRRRRLLLLQNRSVNVVQDFGVHVNFEIKLNSNRCFIDSRIKLIPDGVSASIMLRTDLPSESSV